MKKEKSKLSQIAEDIYTYWGCTEKLTKDFIMQSIANVRVFDKKQKDYGSRNISEFGEQGVLVRSSDKFERLKNLHGKIGIYTPSDKNIILQEANESIDDTWLDISNYAIIAQMIRNDKWPM